MVLDSSPAARNRSRAVGLLIEIAAVSALLLVLFAIGALIAALL